MKDVMTITPLGSGQEVGRSCHLLEFRGVTILLDCGIHPGYDSIHGLPFFDRLEPDQIDLVLITHFHLDHVASLPYFTERTGFKGRVFMTHPTKAVTRLLLGDYLRLLAMRRGSTGGVSSSEARDENIKGSGNESGSTTIDDILYSESDLQSCMEKIELIDYHQTISIDFPLKRSSMGGENQSNISINVAANIGGSIGVKFHALNAGHVLGACMYVIELGGRTVLYTGDYSTEEDRHLMGAELPISRGFLGGVSSTESDSTAVSDVVMTEANFADSTMTINEAAVNPSAVASSASTNATTGTSIANITTGITAVSGSIPSADDRVSYLHPDVLIVESTYGVQVHASRAEREARFTATVERIVTRGGSCLIPVFALGRAQELLLILDEYWQQHSHLQSVPIWYASKLASRALRVYQTYANMMNARIRAQMDVGNPFALRHIRNLKSIDSNNNSDFDDRAASVVFASPGMLQSGVSRKLFDRWASDPKNGVIIAGYAVDHTLAKEILNQPKEVVTLEGRRQPLNCLVDYVSFSAHVDFMQNKNFITKVQPKHIILVHGAKEEMGRLKSALMLQFRQLPENKRPTISMPPNLQEVKFEFARRRSAKVIGSLANTVVDSSAKENHGPSLISWKPPQEGNSVDGILVTQNYSSKIVAADDLATYTPLRVGSVSSTLHVPFIATIVEEGGKSYGRCIDTFRFVLKEMFSDISESSTTAHAFVAQTHESSDLTCSTSTSKYVEDEDDHNFDRSVETDRFWNHSVSIFGLHNNEVTITIGKLAGIATVEWNASPLNDVLADTVVALLMYAQSSSASIRLTSKSCSHRHRRRRSCSKVGINEEWNNKSGAEGLDIKASMTSRHSSILHLCRDALMESYNKVESTFDLRKADFEVHLDTGSGATTNGEDSSAGEGVSPVVCVATVEFEHEASFAAKVTVECIDAKVASSIQDCLRNIISASVPIVL